MSVPAIEGRGLTRRFHGFTALDSVDLQVPRGQVRGLIGPNGAGKSTLIDVLAGGAQSWSGSVLLQGEDVSARSIQERRRRGLARSFQRINIFPALTVRTQLELAARNAPGREPIEVMAALALTPLADRVAAEISYGDQRRLDLALALVGQPRVLLLDEPAAGLSMSESLVLANLVRDLARHWEVTVLLVEHDMEVVFAISDWITVLHLGRILAEGTVAEIRRNPAVVTAYLGSAATAAA